MGSQNPICCARKLCPTDLIQKKGYGAGGKKNGDVVEIYVGCWLLVVVAGAGGGGSESTNLRQESPKNYSHEN